MSFDERAALFLMLGQAADKAVGKLEDVVPTEKLLLSASYDLAMLVPEKVKRAVGASQAYQLFFVLESYLREFIVEVLSKEATEEWWAKVPKDVKDEVARLEETEEVKSWMALGSRDKSALLTLPQLLRVIDENWKSSFQEIVRDKALIQEARTLVHLRNTICHMTLISDEEMDRIKQTMRDWFRVVAP
ncbi:Swt1 family HEPN domain-containing protein [Leptospira interrogans]